MTDTWDRLLAPLLRARRFDELLVENSDRLTGAYHVSIGGEAAAAALACVRRDGDAIMLNHRNHGYLAALGSDPGCLYRELLGRDGGLQRGRSGSFHLADPSLGVPYTSAMLGGGAALAAGLALARKRRRQPSIAFAFFGDGAMGEGIVFETMNLAVVWELALVLVCDNNTASGREGHFAHLAEAHGVAAAVADARRPRQTLAALAAAADAARSSSRPQFLELGSQPWPGNAGFLPRATAWLELDACAAPPQGEFDAADPVREEAHTLLGQGIALERLTTLDGSIRASLRSAWEQAIAALPAPTRVAHEEVWSPS